MLLVSINDQYLSISSLDRNLDETFTIVSSANRILICHGLHEPRDDDSKRFFSFF